MKIVVHIIWVLTQSDIKFEIQNQFCKNITNFQKLGQTLNLLDFRVILNIFAKLIFALKFNI